MLIRRCDTPLLLAAGPKAIRELTPDDIDLPSRRITIAGHRQRPGELTRNALLAWLEYRRATWPNRHCHAARNKHEGTMPSARAGARGPPWAREADLARRIVRR
jgi:hypothetical protein